jgi:hypothetical protein
VICVIGFICLISIKKSTTTEQDVKRHVIILIRNINAKFIEKKVGEVMSEMVFTKEKLAEIDLRVRNDVSTFEEKRIAEINGLEQQKRKLREDLSYLRTNKLSLLKNSVYSSQEYLFEESKLLQGIEKLMKKEKHSEVSMHEII